MFFYMYNIIQLENKQCYNFLNKKIKKQFIKEINAIN